jgi:hypothetical protein
MGSSATCSGYEPRCCLEDHTLLDQSGLATTGAAPNLNVQACMAWQGWSSNAADYSAINIYPQCERPSLVLVDQPAYSRQRCSFTDPAVRAADSSRTWRSTSRPGRVRFASAQSKPARRRGWRRRTIDRSTELGLDRPVPFETS